MGSSIIPTVPGSSGQSDAEAADLVVVMEPLHLHWMRRNLPAAASMTGSLRRLVRDLPTSRERT